MDALATETLNTTGLAVSNLTIANGLLVILVFARIAGMIIAMPSLLSLVSWRIRLVLVLAITAVVVPSLIGQAHPPSSGTVGGLVVNIIIACGREVILGMIIGGVVQLLVSGVQLAGELITSVAGLPIGPGGGDDPQSLPALSRLIGLLVTAVMLTAGGHRYLMSALMESFTGIAPGAVEVDATFIDLIVNQLTTGMSAGVRVAAPVVAVTLATQLLVGFISRTLPQINVFAVGLNLNVLAMLIVTAITIGSAGLIFQNELTEATRQLHELW